MATSIFPVARRNAMLDSLTASHLSAYDGDPLASGTEVASSRTSVTFGAASNGVRSMSTSNPEIAIPGGGTQVTHITAHSAASSGVITAVAQLDSPETFGSAGALRVTSWTLTLSDPA